MVLRNKYLIIFITLISTLGLYISTQFFKAFHLFIQHTTYYCQTFFVNHPIRIPHLLGVFTLIAFSIILVNLIRKICTAYLHIQRVKKTLKDIAIPSTKLESLLREYDLLKKVCIIRDSSTFSFCFGIRNPKIYISTGTIKYLNNQELKAVLVHEKYHLQQRDGLIMLLASITQSLFPFIPIVNDILSTYKIEREIHADQLAIRALGSKKPILCVLKKMLNSSLYPSLSSASIADIETIEPRIRSIVEGRKSILKVNIQNVLISLLSLLIFSLVAFTPVEASNSTIQGSTCNSSSVPFFSYSSHEDNVSRIYTPAH